MFFSDASGVVDGSCVDGSSSGRLRHCGGCDGFADARGMRRCKAGPFRSLVQVYRIEINAEEHGSLVATSLGVWGLYIRGDSGCRRVLHSCTDIRLLHGGLSNSSGYGWLFHCSVGNEG